MRRESSAKAPRTHSGLAWSVLLDIDDQSDAPLYERLTHALREAIRTGRITNRAALPPSRMLASDLGCSRWVVMQAYSQLIAEGYLEARTGSATWVRWPERPRWNLRYDGPERPEAHEQMERDPSPDLPDPRAFPRQRWQAALRDALETMNNSDLGYPPSAGHPRLREMVAEYLNRCRGVRTAPSHVTVCSSMPDAFGRICRALHDSGHAIALEDPGSPLLRMAAAAARLEVVLIPVDDGGLRVEELFRQPAVRAVLVAPAHQFPTGVALRSSRRAALLAWARRVGGLIVEDDSGADLWYEGRAPAVAQGADPGRVALLGSPNSTMSPAIGLAWLITPPSWTAAVSQSNLTAPTPSTLSQLTFARLLESGGYDRHLRTVRQRYRDRRDRLVGALRRAFGPGSVHAPNAGLHVVLHLDPGVDVPAVVRALGSAGVRLADLSRYRAGTGSYRPALVLGYGDLPDTAIRGTVDLLRRSVRQARPEAA